jgi:energy-coupling factor transport system permease protein
MSRVRTRRRAVRSVRPRLAAAWMGMLLLAAICLRHPAALLGLLLAILWLGSALGARRPMVRMLRFAMPFAALLFVVQVLIDRNGLTVLARLGSAGFLGELDLTLEAVCGATAQALRGLCALLVSALALELVDVDRVLASIRRRAPRFGVASTLALRLVPLLAGDGRRYADGLRCRADGGGLGVRDRALVVSALLGRTLDRAGDAAGVLELRGLSRPARGVQPAPRRWSRAELGAAAGTLAAAAALAAALVSGADRFETLPVLHGAAVLVALPAGLAVGAATLLPLLVATRRPGARA